MGERGVKESMFSVFVFISMLVCPSCVIPQSSRAPRFALLHVCSHKTLLQRNSHFFSSTPSTLLSSSRLLFTNFCSLILPKICLPVSAPLPTQSYLSPSCSSSFFSHSFHMFSPIHSPILPCLTLPLSPSPPFSLSPCPSPSLLIRAICWRRRQGDLTMDIIVLNVDRAVQCWESAVCVCIN